MFQRPQCSLALRLVHFCFYYFNLHSKSSDDLYKYDKIRCERYVFVHIDCDCSLNRTLPHVAPGTEIRIPESGNFLTRSRWEKFACAIRNITNAWNSESKLHWHWLESSTWDPKSAAWNPESKTVLVPLHVCCEKTHLSARNGFPATLWTNCRDWRTLRFLVTLRIKYFHSISVLLQ